MKTAMQWVQGVALAVGVIATITVRPAPAVGMAQSDEIQRVLDAYVSKAPGVVVIAGVMEHGNVHVYTAGRPPKGAPTLNETTEFQIGSVTKTFTATLLAQMTEHGDARLEDPLQTYVPPSVRIPTYRGQSISLASLAEQNSGLPRLPANLALTDAADPYSGYTEQQLYAAVASQKLTGAPGAQYEYSNFGIALLGNALAYHAHAAFAELLASRVLTPLGMNDTVFSLSGDQQSRLMPGLTSKLAPAPPWHLGPFDPAGGLYSTMRDMLLYLQANVDAPNGPLGTAMASAQEPRGPSDMGEIVKIGLAWTVNTSNYNTWHNGETGGYHAFIGFNRLERDGVVLLTNIADTNADLLAVHILAPTTVQTPPPAGS
jgi:serine-type D-Ala-D-Ala carboxypeptidase/endopeptidase